MASYSVETTLSPTETVEKAKTYFGKGGLGLEMTAQGDCFVHFTGSGGFVQVWAGECNGGTSVKLETREWDNPVKSFMVRISS